MRLYLCNYRCSPFLPLVSLSCVYLAALLWQGNTVTAQSTGNNNPYTASPPIKARIQASWDAAPLIVQILETVSLESPQSFFPLLDLLSLSSSSSDSPLSSSLSPADVYSRSLILLESPSIPISQSPASLDSFKLALSVREASPLIETFYQIYGSASTTLEVTSTDESWISWNGKRVGDVKQIEKELSSFSEGFVCGTDLQCPKLYAFDHVHPSSPKTAPPVVLYADPRSTNFASLHQFLSALASAHKIRYIIRWKPSPHFERKKLLLSGYGAGLDIKRVDYLTIDDRDLAGGQGDQAGTTASSNSAGGSTSETGKLAGEQSIFDQADAGSELVQLKPAQLEDIGLRASQLVLSSSNPLETLKRLSQDFPRYAHRLATSWVPIVNDSLKAEMRRNNEQYIEGGRNVVWLNGMPLREEEMRPFSLLRTLRKERKTLSSLMALGLTSSQAIDILSHPSIGAASSSAPPPAQQARGLIPVSSLGELFDSSDARESPSSSPILYWNDIERDSRYKGWSRSLSGLMQQMYQGQLPQIRRNLINVVMVMDLEKRDSHAILSDNVATFISRGLGVRFGMVPLLREREKGDKAGLGEAVARVIWYLVEKGGRASAIAFSRELAQHPEENLTLDRVRAAYATTYKHSQNLRASGVESAPHLLPNVDELLASDLPELEGRIERVRAYNKRLGLGSSAEDDGLGSFFVNGRLFPLDEEFRQNLQQSMSLQIQYLTQQLYLQNIDDSDDIASYFYSLPSTYPSRNPFIFPDEEKNPLRIVDMGLMEEKSGVKCASSGDSTDAETEMSMWVIADLTTPAGMALLNEAEEYTARDSTIRICAIHNPATLPSATIATDTDDAPQYRWRSGKEETGASSEATSSSQAAKQGQALAAFIGLRHGESGMIINGRVIGPLPEGSFSSSDFEALASYERKKRFDPILSSIKEALGEDYHATTSLTGLSKPDFLVRIASVVALAYLPEANEGLFSQRSMKRSRDYRLIPASHSSVVLGDEETALFQFGVLLDPLSESAQSWSAILETLSAMSSVSIRLYMNPNTKRTEIPLKRFYRYSLAPSLSFDSTTGQETLPSVAFHNLPQSTLLTLALDTQHAWQAFPKVSVHDLDNLRLSDLKASSREQGVDALFELSNIIVEGHARESKTGMPPRGLQLLLSNGNESTDTLVMANLGYHQLKANPGVWDYRIRDGRSSEVFVLDSIGMPGDSGEAEEIAVTSFEGVTVYPKFSRQQGMGEVDLLNEAAEVPEEPIGKKAAQIFTGLKDRVQGFFGKPAAPVITDIVKTKKKGAEINIFTVASGLLYERMAMIMILSVLRHTESTVKFWFINNFLSPSFKAFIPHLASAYGFEYELITYTWPAWLRSQKEKQRTIWGYKILFLDVLFPLGLERVIFVDSDQIVRTDLKQLVDMDLKGAPYAYTPMGEDREEMENFRFWKGGYWKDHLRGKPYHISALYVIDLDRFRQIAAGDRLRGQYQGLSADPNSLANLDQDLPNNMQNSIPIHTLDRSWLWCETWCSDESLKDAKTIDLCNNPKTHEPKLARAKRLIPEWTVYDKEIADLAKRVSAKAASAGQRNTLAGEQAREGDSSAGAFEDEAGQLQQARMQQVEFVEEGTGKDSAISQKAQEHFDGLRAEKEVSGHIKDEL